MISSQAAFGTKFQSPPPRRTKTSPTQNVETISKESFTKGVEPSLGSRVQTAVALALTLAPQLASGSVPSPQEPALEPPKVELEVDTDSIATDLSLTEISLGGETRLAEFVEQGKARFESFEEHWDGIEERLDPFGFFEERETQVGDYTLGFQIADLDLSPRFKDCLLYTSPSPRDQRGPRMPSSA